MGRFYNILNFLIVFVYSPEAIPNFSIIQLKFFDLLYSDAKKSSNLAYLLDCWLL